MAVAVLFTASCAKEDISSSIGGGEVEVTFTANLPELGTRAYADGTNANILYYNVYDAATDTLLQVSGSKEAVAENLFIVNIPMLKGMTYDIVFWAENKDGGYYTLNGKEITVKFEDGNKDANDNNRDAFYAYVEGFDPTDANADTTIELYRPFGQLNAATNDYEAISKNLVTLTTSSLKVTTFSKLNLETGIATDAVEVTFDATAMPCMLTIGEEILMANYKYLSMNYLLPGTVDAEFTFKGTRSNGSEVEFTGTTYHAVPVKANYRTNILGALLTKPTDFEVKIEADFDVPAEDIDGVKAVTTNVATIAELQNAINDAKIGHNVIKFEKDIDADSTRAALAEITIVQKPGINLTIDGCGYKYEGKIIVDGAGRSTGAETLTFNNIKFYTDYTTSFTFIEAPKKIKVNGVEHHNYPHNITIDGCSFEFNGNGTVTEIGSASFIGAYNIRMHNCTATNMHSLLQVQSCDNTVVVDNVTVTDCKNGISFGNTAYPTLTNATINSREYGVRGDGDANRGNLVIKNSSINAKQPVVIRKVKTNGYSVALEGKNTLNPTGLYHVTFTSGDDGVDGVAPTATWSISGAEGYNVFPVEDGAPIYASSEQQISAAIGAGITEITLNEGEYVIPDSAKGKTVTFVGNGNVKVVAENDGAAEGNCDYSLRGSTATFKNITITTTGTYFPGYAGLKGTFENCTINGVYTTYDSSTFKNCTFNFSGDNYNLWTWGAAEVTLDGCTFNCDGKAVLLYGTANTKLTVNNCTFNDKGGLTDLKAAIEIGNDYGASYELIVNNATVNGFEINDKGINTGTTLWANKNSMGTDKLNVVVDGVDVY